MLDKAIKIAVEAHRGQVDKGGEPYILHPLRLMLKMATEDERICAVLHDVVEDSSITFEDLKTEGFSAAVIDALRCLTKEQKEEYGHFVERIMQNMLAAAVKLADLYDNMDLTRIKEPTKKDYERVEKYKAAAKQLSNMLKNKKGKDITEVISKSTVLDMLKCKYCFDPKRHNPNDIPNKTGIYMVCVKDEAVLKKKYQAWYVKRLTDIP